MILPRDDFDSGPAGHEPDRPDPLSDAPGSDGDAQGPLAMPAHVENAFAPDGWLRSSLRLEHRPGQSTMATAVAEHLELGQPLLVEAGTGVGKSLAYLIPGLLWAVETGRPLVVSTHTISLQEQIERKDLARCRELFNSVPALHHAAAFQAAVLVGKGNYLCSTRLAHALQHATDLIGGSGHSELERVAAWARSSPDGLRHELHPSPDHDVWDLVNADASTCSRRNCSPETCPYQRARARVARSHLRIVNHSLLFALLAAGGPDGGRGILYTDDAVVLDEAHTLPEVATDHLGLSLSSYALDRLLKALHNPARDRGLLKRFGRPTDRAAVASVATAATHFFAHLDAEVLANAPHARLRTPDRILGSLEEPLTILEQSIRDITARLEDGPARDELEDHRLRAAAWRLGVIQFRTLARDGEVHWAERTGRHGSIIALRSAPLDVAAHLRDLLFRRNTAAILTSATLAVSRDLSGFAEKVGAPGARTQAVSSPFDFARQMRVFAADDAPEPSPDSRRLDREWLARRIAWCISRIPGGSLVLFTSRADLAAVSDALDPVLSAAGRRLLVQGRDGGRTEVTRAFAAAGNAVLCGTDSFWTGVDIPGTALSQVIITRLPFEFPNHPVPEARSEWVRSRGGNPFNELTLPAALVQFRQGVGRLIRTVADVGVITILDRRLFSKSYGRLFIDTLPTRSVTRFNEANKAAVFQAPDPIAPPA